MATEEHESSDKASSTPTGDDQLPDENYVAMVAAT